VQPTTISSAGLLVLPLGGASLALALTGAGRFSADGALGLTRYFRAGATRTRDVTT
jgi:hypothetical protein